MVRLLSEHITDEDADNIHKAFDPDFWQEPISSENQPDYIRNLIAFTYERSREDAENESTTYYYPYSCSGTSPAADTSTF